MTEVESKSITDQLKPNSIELFCTEFQASEETTEKLFDKLMAKHSELHRVLRLMVHIIRAYMQFSASNRIIAKDQNPQENYGTSGEEQEKNPTSFLPLETYEIARFVTMEISA